MEDLFLTIGWNELELLPTAVNIVQGEVFVSFDLLHPFLAGGKESVRCWEVRIICNEHLRHKAGELSLLHETGHFPVIDVPDLLPIVESYSNGVIDRFLSRGVADD